MIGEFIGILDVGAGLGLISFDEDTVRAPHRDVGAFDTAAPAADAERLRTLVDRLDPGATTGTEFDDLWSGPSGAAAGRTLSSATTEFDAALCDLAATAAAVESAAAAVEDVVTRYRQAMRTVCDRLLAGVDVDALPVSVAAGSVAKDQVRAELVARIDYADAVGRTASRALVDIAAAAAGRAASAGELVLAGLR